MPYSQITLDNFAIQLGVVLDDTSEVYWSRPEKYFAIWEALNVWGALTNYWRTRGVFNITPGLQARWGVNTSQGALWGSFPWGGGVWGGGSGQSTPSFPGTPTQTWYDLSVLLKSLRTRVYTLGQMVQEIQYHLMEAPNGISGAGMSGQVTVTSILNAIQDARNRFVLDARFPLSVHGVFTPAPPPAGMVSYPQTSVYVHRASWIDASSLKWTNLWREDSWAMDKGNPTWTVKSVLTPQSFSEAENSPLKLQISPPPRNTGGLEALTVDSLTMNLADPNATFNIPDEWIHAVKYSALAKILRADSQIYDPLRASFAEKRYSQSVQFARDAKSILRLLCNNVPLNMDPISAVDSAYPYWRNAVGKPFVAGCLYDLLGFNPPDTVYGIAADVVQSAPLPSAGINGFMPIGEEDLDIIKSYALNYLMIKCGGNEFKESITFYDDFLSAVSKRGNINRAKIQYLDAFFNQPQGEWQMNPDRVEAGV